MKNSKNAVDNLVHRTVEIRKERRQIKDLINTLNKDLRDAKKKRNFDLVEEITEDIKCYEVKLEQLENEYEDICYRSAMIA